jgi:two-component system sensor histidine kinase YesM
MDIRKNKDLLVFRLYCFLAALGFLMILLFSVAFILALQNGLITLLFIIALLTVALCIAAYFLLWRPYREITRQINSMAVGPSFTQIRLAKWHYNEQSRLLLERISRILKESNSFDLSKRQAQYQALQNQINPHFLYNTLESIRSEALISGLDSVAGMCEALASFFRYTISNQDNLVTMEEEIQNVKAYFYIQQYRFGSRLHLKVEYEDNDFNALLKCKIPKLTLQPIVENAIIHGIEQKLGDGTVTIRLILTERNILIKISDDGVGMSADILKEINRRIADGLLDSSGKGGIAIGNVDARIKLLFSNAYGVTVYSTQGIGTDVEITLPYAT